MQSFRKPVFGSLGSFRPLTPQLGCAPCMAMQKQKEANEEFARRFGIVRPPGAPIPVQAPK